MRADARLAVATSQLFNQIIGFKVLITAENRFQQLSALAGDALAAAVQELLKPFQRRQRDVHFAQGKIQTL